MQRLGGHPYESGALMPYNIVDPTQPDAELLTAVGYNQNDLPLELHPKAFPELLIGWTQLKVRFVRWMFAWCSADGKDAFG